MQRCCLGRINSATTTGHVRTPFPARFHQSILSRTLDMGMTSYIPWKQNTSRFSSSSKHLSSAPVSPPFSLSSSNPQPPPLNPDSIQPASSSPPSSSSQSDPPPPPPPPPTPPKRMSFWQRLQHEDEEKAARRAEKQRQLQVELRSITGRHVSELYRTGGKPYLTPSSLSPPNISLHVPPSALSAQTMDGRDIQIPEDCAKYKATMIAVGYNQQMLDWSWEWLSHLESLYPQTDPLDTTNTPVRILQLSIISNSLIGSLFGSYLSRRVKQSLPPSRHSSFVMMLNNPFDPAKLKSTYIDGQLVEFAPKILDRVGKKKEELPMYKPRRTAMEAERGWSIHNPMLAHLILLDNKARVRWRAVGKPNDEEIQYMINAVNSLIDEKPTQPPPPTPTPKKKRR